MTADNTHIHFKILDQIARDLSGDVNFPTCLDAAVMIRNTLRDPLADLAKVVQVVGVEPLISSKLLRIANSVVYNPSGWPITDLSTAIGRLGFEVVRTTSLAVAMDQMLKSRHLAFEHIGHKAWEHSLEVAAIARVLARRLGRVNPDEAMLAGLVHDIGVFYLLYRAAEFPEYRGNETALLELLRGWHESIGEGLLYLLGLPEEIANAISEHDHLTDVGAPCSIRDVLYFANLLAGGDQDWLPSDITPEQMAAREADRERYAEFVAEAEADIQELRATLSA